MIFILKGEAGWAIQLVGRYHDTLHHRDGDLALPPPGGRVRDYVGPDGPRAPVGQAGHRLNR